MEKSAGHTRTVPSAEAVAANRRSSSEKNASDATASSCSRNAQSGAHAACGSLESPSESSFKTANRATTPRRVPTKRLTVSFSFAFDSSEVRSERNASVVNAYVSADSRSSFVRSSAARSRSLKHAGFVISVNESSSPGFKHESVNSTINPSPHANSRSSRPGAKATHVADVVSFNTSKRVRFATQELTPRREGSRSTEASPKGFPEGTSHTSSEAV